MKTAGKGNFKIIGAQKAKSINNYKNIKYKLLQTNVPIWCNKTAEAVS
jgi:hypothetical protein